MCDKCNCCYWCFHYCHCSKDIMKYQSLDTRRCQYTSTTTLMDTTIKTPLLSKCDLCENTIDMETALRYNMCVINGYFKHKSLLCSPCIQRIYYGKPQ